MEIRKSRLDDMDAMMAIYEDAREFMKASGNPDQWVDGYPKQELLEEDMKSGHSYVCVENGEIVGTFYFAVQVEADYGKIYEGAWLDDKPYGVIHRIASAKGTRGVASFCMDWCMKECGNIRIDTHRDNVPMQNMLKKNGYEYCGIIYLANGDERFAFQKTVKS